MLKIDQILCFIFYQSFDWIWNSPFGALRALISAHCVSPLFQTSSSQPSRTAPPSFNFLWSFSKMEKVEFIFSPPHHAKTTRNRMMMLEKPRKSFHATEKIFLTKGLIWNEEKSWKDFSWKEDFRLRNKSRPAPGALVERRKNTLSLKVCYVQQNFTFFYFKVITLRVCQSEKLI